MNAVGRPSKWNYAVRIALLIIIASLPFLVARRQRNSGSLGGADDGTEYRQELLSYIVGAVLAFVLTAIPFALVHWDVFSRPTLLLVIAGFAFVQIIAHFRCFLHIDPPHQNTDDLILILFTTLIVAAMAGGTLWVLGNLAARMM